MTQVRDSERRIVALDRERHVIDVSPTSAGWTVTADAVEVLVFSQGGQAERSARRLATAMAQVGQPAEIRIHLRDGSLAGRYVVSTAGPP